MTVGLQALDAGFPRGRCTAVDLYCGCGAVTEGLKRSGFSVVAAVDNDPIACRTYERNHPEVVLYNRDIRKVDPVEIRQGLLCGRDVDLLVVCAPCQPFSSLNKNAGGKDAGLILEAVRFVRVLRPAVIFFENVPGLARYHKILQKLERALTGLGYRPGKPDNVDAADYGVPQRRARWVLIAARGVSPGCLPEPITPEGMRNTVRRAIGGLKPLAAGQCDPDDPLHAARNHHALTIRRLRHIPRDGGSRNALPPHLELRCHRNNRGFPDVYGRMAWDKVAPTLTTGCTDVTRGRFAHPEQDRAITLREAALLQTFPETYIFEGSTTHMESQIGNAVPVNLVIVLAPFFIETIEEVRATVQIYGEAAGGD